MSLENNSNDDCHIHGQLIPPTQAEAYLAAAYSLATGQSATMAEAALRAAKHKGRSQGYRDGLKDAEKNITRKERQLTQTIENYTSRSQALDIFYAETTNQAAELTKQSAANEKMFQETTDKIRNHYRNLSKQLGAIGVVTGIVGTILVIKAAGFQLVREIDIQPTQPQQIQPASHHKPLEPKID